VGVPLGWLFLANKQLFTNYIWRCDCIWVTTSIQVTKVSDLLVFLKNNRYALSFFRFFSSALRFIKEKNRPTKWRRMMFQKKHFSFDKIKSQFTGCFNRLLF
jgi:hypothetical protein